jgi:transposase
MRSHRTLMVGSIYRLRTGCAWRDLPGEFWPWQTVWKRHARCCKDGTWDSVLIAVQAEADARGEIDWNVSIDSMSARVHQHGATGARSEVEVNAQTGGSVEGQGITGWRLRTGRSLHRSYPRWPDNQKPCAGRRPWATVGVYPDDRRFGWFSSVTSTAGSVPDSTLRSWPDSGQAGRAAREFA